VAKNKGKSDKKAYCA